jgi:hypothetical protein
MDDTTTPDATATAVTTPGDTTLVPNDTLAPADNTAPKQRGQPFQPGKSGNPNGRPKGSRNKVSQAIEAVIHSRSEELVEKAIELAMAGDTTMLRGKPDLRPKRPESTLLTPSGPKPYRNLAVQQAPDLMLANPLCWPSG